MFLLGLGSAVWAQEKQPSLKVLPWNGHKAATSLTFDDGCPSQLDIAVPELNKRKMQATFFLIANRITRKDEWRKLLVEGHEIGNHTLDHKHVAELTPSDAESQVLGAQHVLQKEFGVPIRTFSYPFSEMTPELKTQVEKTHWLARGGSSQRLLTPEQEPDWWEIHSHKAMTDIPFSTYQKWMDKDLKTGSWSVWMIHSLDPADSGYEPISSKVFGQVLDALQAKDFWVATFQTVGAYWRAQKIFEKAKVESHGDKTWTWEVPKDFHPDVTLKIRVIFVSSGAPVPFEIWQGRQKIKPDEKGVYPINFDKGQLTLRSMPKS